jgi:hypothetical protein
MKIIITLVVILLSTFIYSQEELKLVESFCKVEVWNNDSSRFERSLSHTSCYAFYEGKDYQDSIVMAVVDINTNNVTYYKMYEEMPRKFLHWTYRVRDINTVQECYLHYFRTGEHNMIRVDYINYTIRLINDYWPDSGIQIDPKH